MKLSKKLRTVIIVIALLIIGCAILFVKFIQGETITSYKDEQFKIYECSRPIKAKDGTVPNLFGGRMKALVPADVSEANKYCKVTGIE